MSPQKELSKDGKHQSTELGPDGKKIKAKDVPTGAAFGKATMAQDAVDKSWKASITGLNGDPERNISVVLPAGITYFGGEGIRDGSEVTLYLPDSLNVDTNFIFPWTTDNPDPLRLGGGIVTGEVQEGAQRVDPKKNEPIHAPLLVANRVNGSPSELKIYIPTELGVIFYPEDSGFALVIIDTTTGQADVLAAARSEGSALDMPTA